MAALRTWLSARLPTPSALPSRFVALHQLPRTPAGKVARAALVQLLQQMVQDRMVAAAAGAGAGASDAKGSAPAEVPKLVQLGTPSKPAVTAVAPGHHTSTANGPLEGQTQRHTQGVHAAAPTGAPHSQPPQPPHQLPHPITEAAVMRAFMAELQQPRLEPTDDFFAAGGSSLQAAEMAGWLGCDVRLVIAAPTARRLTALLRSHHPDVDQAQNVGAFTAQTVTARADYDSGRLSGGQGVDAGDEGTRVPAKRARVEPAQPQPPLLQGQPAPAQSHDVSGREPPVVEPSQPHSRVRNEALPSLAQPLRTAAAALSADQARALLSCVLEAGACAARSPSHLGPAGSAAGTILTHACTQTLEQLLALDGRAHSDPILTHPPHSPHSFSQQTSWRLVTDWVQPMGRCIDAPPVVVQVPTSPPAAPSAASPMKCHSLEPGTDTQPSDTTQPIPRAAAGTKLVFCCSHEGDVACFDAHTAACVWSVRLPARAEAGLCVTPSLSHVAVAAGDGQLYCLDMAGQVVGCHSLGGEPKGPPVCDPWAGWVWATSHGRRLVAVQVGQVAVQLHISHMELGLAPLSASQASNGLAPEGQPAACTTQAVQSGSTAHPGSGVVRVSQPLTGPSSCPPVFYTTPSEQRVVVVACLDGSITAWRLEAGNALAQQHAAANTRLIQLWSCSPASAPIFSRPAIDDSAGVLVASHVDGTVVGIGLERGVVAWRLRVTGHVFAPLCLVEGLKVMGTSPSALSAAPATEAAPPPPPAAMATMATPANTSAVAAPASGAGGQASLVLVATHAGEVHAVHTATGARAWTAAIGRGPISAAPCSWVVPQGEGQAATATELHVLVTSSCGVLSLLRAPLLEPSSQLSSTQPLGQVPDGRGVTDSGCDGAGCVDINQGVHLEVVWEAQLPGACAPVCGT